MRSACAFMMILLDSSSLLGLNQYTVESTGSRLTTLTSPRIFQHKACFTFQYFAASTRYYRDSKVFVFARNASNKQLLPFWRANLYHDREKWHTIRILLDLESGFDMVSRLAFISFLTPNRIVKKINSPSFKNQLVVR